MARSPESLWAVPAFLPYVQSALTTEAADAAERQFGVTLPPAYLSMLAVQNGGSLRATWPGFPHRMLYGIGPKFPSLTRDEAWWRDPDADDEIWVPPNPALLIPFDGDGHYDLCFDYRTSGPHAEPAVTYVDIETEEDVAVAGSFGAFLDGLVDDIETTAFRITDDVSLDVFAQALADVTGCDITDQGDWAHGYRHLLVRLDEDALIWVSPNRVPAGYRRDGRRVIATPETTLRLPAEPACHLIVTCTPEAAEATRDALHAIGHDHREGPGRQEGAGSDDRSDPDPR